MYEKYLKLMLFHYEIEINFSAFHMKTDKRKIISSLYRSTI